MEKEKKDKIFDLYTRLLFGKYAGKKLKRVMREDPGYIDWCLENNIFILDEEASRYWKKRK